MKKLQSEDHHLILWTYRSRKKLQEAVYFCKENSIEFYAENKNYAEEEFDGKMIFNFVPEVKKKKGLFSFLR